MVVLAAPLLVQAALAASALMTGYLYSPGGQRQVRQAGRALEDAVDATADALTQAFSHESSTTTTTCPEAAASATTSASEPDDSCRRERDAARAIRDQRDAAERRHDRFKEETLRYEETPGVWRAIHPRFKPPAIGSYHSEDVRLASEATAREQEALSDRVDWLDAELGRADAALNACRQRDSDRRAEAERRRLDKKAFEEEVDREHARWEEIGDRHAHLPAPRPKS